MKHPFILVIAALLAAATPLCASAQAVDVFADQSFRPALLEIVPMFSEQTGFEVRLSIGSSSVLAERIQSGVSADLFFPASEDSMRQLMEKGRVDVALKRNILVLPAREPEEEGVVPEPQYIPAAVLLDAANRLPAMAFLEFLASESAREVFARRGFSLP